MAKRNYQKEYAKEKLYKKKFTVVVNPELYEKFKLACESNGASINSILKEWKIAITN